MRFTVKWIIICNSKDDDVRFKKQHILGMSRRMFAGKRESNMRKIRIVLYAALTIALCLSLCACGSAGGVSISDKDTVETLLDKAYACAYPEDGTEPNFDAARQYFEAAAERGSAEAMNFLGDSYRDGGGLEQDLDLAYYWYERSAETGDMWGMNNLGDMLENGTVCEADPERASELYRKSAELGNVWAYGNTARMYRDGIGVEQDYAKAVEWFEKALSDNPEDVWIMADYAWMYLDGNGVEQDIDRAAELAEKSLAGGNIWAAYLVPELINRGYVCGKALFENAAACFTEIKDPGTLGWLGDMYCFGDGTAVNEERALYAYEGILYDEAMQADYEYWDNLIFNCRWLYANGADTEENLEGAVLCECAANGLDINGEIADADYAAAMSNIGVDYVEGWDEVREDVDRGIRTLEKAASLGNGHSYYNLGNIYLSDSYTAQDLEKALGFYEAGAALGDDDSAVKAAAMHINGEGCEADEDAALRVLTMGGQLSEAEAVSNLGTMYYYGNGVGQDLKKALELFARSADGGCASAVNYLVNMYLNGEGTARDAAKAFELASKAVAEGNDDCFLYTTLGNLCYKGDGTEADAAKAVEYYEKGTQGDPAYAYFMLGDIYSFGPEDMRDDAKALECYRTSLLNSNYPPELPDDGAVFVKAGEQYQYTDASFYDEDKSRACFGKAADFYLPLAEAGDGDAMNSLVIALYRENQVFTPEMVDWLKKGTELQNWDCMCYLANLTISGYAGSALPKDVRKGVALYEECYDLGCRDATLMNQLAYNYVYVLGDVEKGIAYYEEAEDWFTLGEMYETGDHVRRDYDKALEYFLTDVTEFTSHHIADIYYNLGDYENAAEYYARYLTLNDWTDFVSHCEHRLNECYLKLGE